MWRNAVLPAGCPSTVTVPDLTICTPTIARINVVLPLPLGPSSPVTLPAGTTQSTPCSTVRFPRSTTRSRTSTAVSMAAPRFHQPMKSTLDEFHRHVQTRADSDRSDHPLRLVDPYPCRSA